MKSIVILSVPRSGSSWFGKILATAPKVAYRFQPNFAYTFPHRLSLEDSFENYQIFLEELLKTEDPFVRGELSISGTVSQIEDPRNPKFLVWKEVHFLNLASTLVKYPEVTVIGIIRSPLAVLASWFKTPREFSPEWEIEEEWEMANSKNIQSPGNHFGYLEWKKVSDLFFSLNVKYPDRFLVCSYEELLRNRHEYVREIFNRLGLQYTLATETFLSLKESIVDEDPYSTNKVIYKDDKWRENLPGNISEQIQIDPQFIFMQKIFNWST